MNKMLVIFLVCLYTLILSCFIKVKMDYLNEEIENLKNQSKISVLTMTVTAFTLSSNECGGNTKNTSLMTKPKSGWTVAVSPDNMHMLGKKVYIEGYGIRKVESLTSKVCENTIDILVSSVEEAKEIGRKETKIVLLK